MFCEAIQSYLKEHSDVGPTAAAKAISLQNGQNVPASYVSNIKSTMGKGEKKGRPGSKPGRKPAAAASAAPSTNGSAKRAGLDLATLESIKSIVDRLGADTAKRVIDLLA